MSKPSSLGPVTSVVVAQTSAAVSTPSEVATSASTSAVASATGQSGAVEVRVGMVKGGLVLGLGALAVAVLM